MELDQDKSLREHLLYVLQGGGAHLDFESVIKDFPVEAINRPVAHLPYTAWQLLEHMRIAQADILEFTRNASHVSPAWPEGYWPDKSRAANESDWNDSIEAFRKDLAAMEALVTDMSNNLFAPLAHGEGQTILREALLIADHNAYHLGALVNIKRMLMATDEAS
ncbi:MAG: hypothetical protein QOD00_3068 [Blastocatellia bacterium]|jgi:hypothetical protein|nr:hypothetical protein [Blastocatellia bacterium]